MSQSSIAKYDTGPRSYSNIRPSSIKYHTPLRVLFLVLFLYLNLTISLPSISHDIMDFDSDFLPPWGYLPIEQYLIYVVPRTYPSYPTR